MKRIAQAETKLRELLERGGVPSAHCGAFFLELIAPLLATGAVVRQRSGAGLQLTVKDPEVVRSFVRKRFPAPESSGEAGGRVAAVARYRDSKALANDTAEILLLRVWCEASVMKHGEPVGAASLTAAHGVFSFLLTPDAGYELRGPCALVENPTLFVAAEMLNLDVSVVIYGHGRISARVLEWLAGMSDPEFRLVHLPDYDPVGLTEFQRLHARLGERVTLHHPTDLEARFDRFSNCGLLAKRNNRAMLAQLRRSPLKAVKEVVALIDRYNAGLEHEALLFNTTSVRAV